MPRRLPDKIFQEDAPAISILANNHLKKTFMCRSSQSKENVSLGDAECQHLTMECDNPEMVFHLLLYGINLSNLEFE